MDNKPFLDFYENVCSSPEDILIRLENELEYLPFEESKIRVRGKIFPISRQIVAFGDTDLSYTFSGLTVTAQPWIPLVLELKSVVENITGFSYNFVLINRYKDGDCFIGQHKDNEPDLDKNCAICSLSFGETRTMVFKKQNFPDYKLELKSNSLLVIKPPTNTEWTHGIPKQKKRNGVRINLTFRQINVNTLENKRKSTRKSPDDENGKKIKSEDLKDKFAFKESEIPDGIFPIGESVFVYSNSYQGHVSVHIRRFEKFGDTFYPSSDGITLKPRWLPNIAGCQELPKTEEELQENLCLPENEIKITSSDFIYYTFTRIQDFPYGKMSKNITLSSMQWNQILKMYNDISTYALDDVFRAKSKEFLNIYCTLTEEPIKMTIPESFDVNRGTEYLTDILKMLIYGFMINRGKFDTPEKENDDTYYNNVKTFNTLAFSMNLVDIVKHFRNKCSVSQNVMCLKATMYITQDFLRNLRLDTILRSMRKYLCSSSNTLKLTPMDQNTFKNLCLDNVLSKIPCCSYTACSS